MQLISHVYDRSRDYFIPKSVNFNKDRLINCFLSIFSAKQATRSDSVITCCLQVISYLRQSLLQASWKVFFISKYILNIPEDKILMDALLAIEILNRLETSIENNGDNEFALNTKEVEVIKTFFSKTMSESIYFKLNAYLIFVRKEKLWKTLKACKEIFLPIQENCMKSIHKKIEAIDKFSQQSIDSPFNDDDKLTPKDLRLLTVASARAKTLEILNRFQITYPYSKTLYEQWSGLNKINNSKTVKHLKDLCMKGYTCGRVFFYDWSFIEIRDFRSFSFKEIIKHVLYGRIPHVAIVVKDSQNQTSLSHVNGATGTHALHPIRFPVLGALGNFAELDILPLLPPEVSLEHKKFLQKYFSEAFIRLASEEHPNIVLEWKHLLTFFCGHKSLAAHNLSEIELISKQSQLCSSYVGIIFLKAVHEINLQLEILGYKKKVQHPFGNHEIIDRVDIPRLLYHWKQLKIIKAVPVDIFVSKVFTTPTL
jgi:hypothetical protein